MPKKTYKKGVSQNFFTKNGKKLSNYKDFNAVYSLQSSVAGNIAGDQEPEIPAENLQSERFVQNLKEKRVLLIAETKELLNKIGDINKLKFSMVSLGINVALIVAVVFLTAKSNSINRYRPKYSIFSSKPLISLVASANLFGGDTRAASLDKILEAYKCPLAGHGKTFVKEADKNKIPYWLVASIAFQESGCGKVTPQAKVAGQEDVTNPEDLKFEESYNAWGWGVWGKNIRTFTGWDDGIKTVSKYLGDSFFSKGITDTCEIMKTYTPPSDGSWCKGVNYFGEMIQTYSSPTN